ncbi:MAG: hypothetical protein E7423_06715 [Ruminococcaceae bacterium]|nr:hypothetical protein [Oscillospiraceae bacterium]
MKKSLLCALFLCALLTFTVSAEELPRLSAPEDLAWGVFTTDTWTADGSVTYRETAVPGAATCTLGETTQNRLLFTYYRVAEDGADLPVARTTHTLHESALHKGFRQSDVEFLRRSLPSGDYYFTATAKGDSVSYRDSEPAVSPVWHYERPEAQLTAPEAPVWQEADDPSTQYAASFAADETNAFGYEMQFFFTAEKDGELKRVGGTTWWNTARKLSELSRSTVDRNDPGWYSACVRILSADVMQFRTSELSPLSEPIFLSASDEALDAILESLDGSSGSDELQAAIDKVRQLELADLADTMAADQEDTEAVAKLEKLAELADIETKIDVTPDMADRFDEAEVSMAGAALNVDPGQSVTLTVDAPGEELVASAMLKNAIRFGMTLTDGTGADLTPTGGYLRVPAKLTLPVPDGVNPDFLVVIHHHADGRNEELFPYVHEKDGRWYATFVVTSFSDFTLAEKCQYKAVGTGDGVEVTLTFTGEDVTALCAAYDGSGRLLAAESVDAMGEEQTVTLSCTARDVRTVKVFALDGEGRPLTERVALPMGPQPGVRP